VTLSLVVFEAAIRVNQRIW